MVALARCRSVWPGNTNYGATAPYGNLFAGTLNNTIGGVTFLSRGAGSTLGTFNLSGGSAYPVLIAGIGGSINFGAISGNQPINNGASAARLSIGNLNTSTGYSGVIGGVNGTGSNGIGILKIGTGSLTLSGQNLYAGQALTAIPGLPTDITSGTLIAGSSSASDGSSGPFGPTTANITGAGPNYVMVGSNGSNLTNSSLQTAGTSVANPIVISAGASLPGALPVVSAYTLSLGGSTDANSTFSGAVTLENNLSVTQVANAASNQLNLTGGLVGTPGFSQPDGAGPIDVSSNASSANNTGFQTITFAGPGNVTVSAGTNTVNGFGIYDSNDQNPLNNTSLGYYSGASGYISVAVTGGVTTFASPNQYSGSTNVSGGTLVLGNLSPALSARDMSAVMINGGTLKIAAANSSSGRNVLVLSSGYTVAPGFVSNSPNSPTAAPSLTITSGRLDVTNNDVIVQGASLGTINALVASGYNAGQWNGTTGIISSTAAASTSHLTAVGVIQNSADGTTSGTVLYPTFDKQNSSDTDVLIKYTYYGDTNLDGKVDGSDYSRIDAGFLSHGTLTGWFNGDFNYDGVINGSDYTLIDNAFNTQGAAFSSEIATATDQIAGSGAVASAVPEPTTLGLLGIGTLGLLARRKRR